MKSTKNGVKNMRLRMNVCKRIVVLLPTWRIGGNKRPDRLAEMGPDRLTEMGSDRLTEM